PERNHARPRASLARRRPCPALARLEESAERARGLAAAQLTAQDRALTRPTGEICGPSASERSTQDEHAEPLEEVRLALGIGARHEVERRGRAEGKGRKIPEIGERYGVNVHPICAPMGTFRSSWA